jgi:hypothetical protein
LVGCRNPNLTEDRRWPTATYTTLWDTIAVPDLTLAEVRNDLAARGVVVSYAGVQRTVKRLGLRFKKTIFATEQDRPDVALARQLWRAAQAGLDFTSLVFVDETSTNTAMTRTHGWGQKG